MKYDSYAKYRRFVHANLPWLINAWRAILRVKYFNRLLIRFHRNAFYSFPLKDRFTAIYKGNLWSNSESVSGYGSTVFAATNTREAITFLISKYQIKSLLDVPCGDFNWMKHLDITIQYIGGDIVDDLIARNNQLYGNKLRSFRVLDLTGTPLPQCDLVLCRDCLNHLSLEHIAKAIANIRSSGARYIAVTHFPEVTFNGDKESDEIYRPINLCLPPFNWVHPTESFVETKTGQTLSEIGKTLSFWEILPTVKE